MRRNHIYLILIIIFLAVVYLFIFSAPNNFPANTVVRVEDGATLRGVSAMLKRENLIRSRVLFESFVILWGREFKIQSADYLFEEKLPVYEIARRISSGEHHMPQVVMTIPEGFNVAEIAEVGSLALNNFNKENFLTTAKPKEGYLFPDTYFFLTTEGEAEVIKSMTENFKKKTELLLAEALALGKTEREIIIMASVIEREAKGNEDRDVISGILWKRLKINMPLQVDAALETYKTRGLPKNPISNPGLLAIKAAIYPKESPYLYYLHDKNGNIHYAKNFAEHVKNKSLYLGVK
jgi:UPF0755 protein